MRTVSATIPPTVSPLSDLAQADARNRRRLPRVRRVIGVVAVDADRQRSLQSELSEVPDVAPEGGAGTPAALPTPAALLAEIDAASPEAWRAAHEGGGVLRTHHYHVDESV